MTDRLVISEKQGDRQIETYERAGVPDLYVDGFHGISASGATIKINLFTRVAPDADKVITHERREVVCRLVLGLDTFFSVVQALGGVADQLRGQLQPQTPRQTQ